MKLPHHKFKVFDDGNHRVYAQCHKNGAVSIDSTYLCHTISGSNWIYGGHIRLWPGQSAAVLRHIAANKPTP